MKSRIIWIFVAISLIIAAVAFNILPDEIPAHYNFEGEVDRMGSKSETFIYPIMIFGMTLFWEIFLSYFRKQIKNGTEEKEIAEAKNNYKILIIAASVVSAMQIVLQIVGVVRAYNYDSSAQGGFGLEMFQATGIVTGIVFIVLGNVIPKTKRNGLLGVRTKWSLANDKTWLATNRLGGVSMCIGGVLIVAGSLVFEGMTAIWIMTGIIMGIVVLVTVYSYVVYKRG